MRIHLLSLAALCLPLHAQSTLYWDGDGSGTVGGKSGTWSTSLARWSTSATGSTYQVWSSTEPFDDAVFQNNAGTVTLGSNVTARSLTFRTTGYTIVGPFNLKLEGGSGKVDTGSGDQSIAVTIAGSNGLNKSGSGTLTLSGANSYTGGTTISAGTLALGHATNTLADTQSVTISGGTLDLGANSDTVGAVSLSAGSITGSGGTLNASSYAFTNTGSVSANLAGSGALTKTGSGTLTLSGANSYSGGTTISAGTLTMGVGSSISHSAAQTFIGNGNGDIGALQFSGGTVSNTNATIGNAVGSEGAATVTSGTWTNSGTLYVGYSGTGSLLVDGGTVSSASARLGFTGTTGIGSATVSNGTWEIGTGLFQVGRAGSGSLTVSSGGLVSVDSITYTGFYGGSTGSITLTGTTGNRGTLSTLQLAEYQGAGTVTFDGGILQARVDESDFISNYESGDVTIDSGGAFIDSNGFAIGISSSLGGTGGLTKQGTGTLTLSGTNTYSGSTTISAGTLQGSSSSLQGNITNNAGLVFDQSNNGTYSDAISGSGSFSKTGSGTLTLGSTHTYAGGTNVEAGTLALGHATDTLANTGAVTISGGTLALGANSDTVDALSLSAGSITGSGGTLTASSYAFTNTGSVSAHLAGSGALTKTGGGTLTLSSANTYTGGTTISAGILALGHATDTLANTGAVTISGGTLALGANSDTVGALSLSAGSITGSGGTLTASSYAFTNTGSVSAHLAGSGALTKTGGGTFTLSSANTYTGGTTISAGILALGHATDTLANTGAVTISGGTLALGANSDTVGALSLSAGSITGSGGTLTAPSYAFTYTGSVSAHLAGSGTLTKTGAGSLTLSGANSYTGGTTINAGTLTVSGTGSISHPSNALAVNSNATLEIAAGGSVANGRGDLGRVYTLNTATADISGTWTNSSDLYVGYLGRASLTVRAGGTVANSTGRVGHLAFGQADISGIWTNSSALIVGSGSNGDLTVKDGGLVNVGSGSGTITLANASAYTGTLNITGSATPGILNTASVYGGAGTAILNFNHTNSDYHFSTDGTATGTAVAITGSTSVNHLGSGTTTLSGTNSKTGRTTVTSGTLAQGTSAAFAPNTAYTVNGGTLDLNDFDLTASSLSGAGGSVDLGTAKLTADQSGNSAYAGTINGTGGSLTKQGAGTLTLSGTNTYTGGTTVNSGLINFASADNLGTAAITLDGGGLQWASGNTLDISNRLNPLGAAGGTFDTNSNNVTLATAMSGTGGLTKEGAGTLTLSGTNTYSGGTTVSAGTLQGNSTSLQGNILNNAALTFDQSPSGTYASAISGTGSLTKQGAGTLTLSGTNAYAGGTTISAGTLALGHATDTLADTGAITISTGTLALGANSDTVGAVSLSSGSITGSGTLTASSYAFTNAGSVSANLAGSGTLIKTGASTVTLSGANTYTGETTINAGTLAVTGTGSVSHPASVLYVGKLNGDTGTLEIADGGTVSNGGGVLGYNSGSSGTADISGTWDNSGELTVGESGTGSLTVQAGGTVSNTNGVLGKNSGSSGTADIAGTWNNSGKLKVGVVGNGSLTVQAGGTVSSYTVQLGGDDNVSATADIAGTWNIGGDLRMGDDGGNGSLLTVQTGGILSSGSADIGGIMVTTVSTDNPDTVNIAGTWNTGQVRLGWGAHGTLAVQNGGRVNVTSGQNIRLGDGLSGGRGTINIEGTTAAGVLNTDSVHGNPDGVGYGSQNKVAVLNFNHTDSDYHFTTDGEATGTAVAITGATAVNHLGTGTTTLSGTNTYSGGTTISAGTLQGSSSSLQGNITNNAALVFDQSFNGTYAGEISGTDGSVSKLGAGTLTLSGNNTYTGGTTVSSGTLSLANNNAAGSGQVTVNGGTLHINEGISPTNAISLAGGSVERVFGAVDTLVLAFNVTSKFTGAMTQTTASFLDGTTSVAATLTGSFSQTVGADNDEIRQSDVFSLSGGPVIDLPTGETDLFVLQLQVANMDADSFLGWLDPETNAWVNAVDGNFGGTSTFLGDGAYNPGTDFVLGYYGIDTANNSVWAVINHNSEFSVVGIPEPSAAAMLGCAVGGMLLLRRRA